MIWAILTGILLALILSAWCAGVAVAAVWRMCSELEDPQERHRQMHRRVNGGKAI